MTLTPLAVNSLTAAACFAASSASRSWASTARPTSPHCRPFLSAVRTRPASLRRVSWKASEMVIPPESSALRASAGSRSSDRRFEIWLWARPTLSPTARWERPRSRSVLNASASSRASISARCMFSMSWMARRSTGSSSRTSAGTSVSLAAIAPARRRWPNTTRYPSATSGSGLTSSGWRTPTEAMDSAISLTSPTPARRGFCGSGRSLSMGMSTLMRSSLREAP